MPNLFIFNGRRDGIGNRIEELIYIQEYCVKNNLKCIYLWNNSSFRNYSPLINFDKIMIVSKIKNKGKLQYKDKRIFIRTKEHIIRFNFTFNIQINEIYDIIIHIRASDRIINNGTHDFSSKEELDTFIKKTIEYVNNSSSINSYSIVSDDLSYKEHVKNHIFKTYINLPYHSNIPKDWLDYYYLTKPKDSILMCCKFSSYSITASILGNKKLLVFSQSMNSNLPRYKADIEVIG